MPTWSSATPGLPNQFMKSAADGEPAKHAQAALFVFDLPPWVGYGAGLGGIASWCMFVSSKQATQPPGHGLFGRRHK